VEELGKGSKTERGIRVKARFIQFTKINDDAVK
jgi:hypothetical protein